MWKKILRSPLALQLKDHQYLNSLRLLFSNILWPYWRMSYKNMTSMNFLFLLLCRLALTLSSLWNHPPQRVVDWRKGWLVVEKPIAVFLPRKSTRLSPSLCSKDIGTKFLKYWKLNLDLGQFFSICLVWWTLSHQLIYKGFMNVPEGRHDLL